jgi:hypothetical protein
VERLGKPRETVKVVTVPQLAAEVDQLPHGSGRVAYILGVPDGGGVADQALERESPPCPCPPEGPRRDASGGQFAVGYFLTSTVPASGTQVHKPYWSHAYRLP